MGRLFNISKHSMGCERTYVVLLSSQKLQGIFNYCQISLSRLKILVDKM